MKLKALVAFRHKFLIKPCKKVITLINFRLKKPVFIRALRSRAKYLPLRAWCKSRIASVLPNFLSSQKSKSMERRNEDIITSCRREKETLIYPSLITPAYRRQMQLNRKQSSRHEDAIEDACRRFENYLLDVIVEDGMRDLKDVEELLYCWKNLKCPVFIDLVCRFYGELCKDLFSSNNDEDCSNSIGC